LKKNHEKYYYLVFYRPFALRKNLGKYPHYSPSLVLVSFLEVGVPSLKKMIFTRGIPTFKNENGNRAWTVMGYSPKKLLNA